MSYTYQMLYPAVAPLYGDNIKDAIKAYVKMNWNMNLNYMILADQQRRFRANFNYMVNDGRNRVGIDMFPVPRNYIIPTVIQTPTVLGPIQSRTLPVYANGLPVPPPLSVVQPIAPLALGVTPNGMAFAPAAPVVAGLGPGVARIPYFNL